MTSLGKIIEVMRSSPASVRFADLEKVCTHYFGPPRLASGSHVVFKTPWFGDPRVNIQSFNGKAKPYQVRQVLCAIEKFTEQHEH